MRPSDCRFHGRHSMGLEVVERCGGCGLERRLGRTSRWALWASPWLWLLLGWALGLAMA